LAINLHIYATEQTISGTFEIAVLSIQFSKNKPALRPELKAQSQKKKVP